MDRVQEAITAGFDWMSVVKWDRPDETGYHKVHAEYPVMINLGFVPEPDELRDQYDIVWNVAREDGIMTCRITVDTGELVLDGSFVMVGNIVRETFFYEEN